MTADRTVQTIVITVVGGLFVVWMLSYMKTGGVVTAAQATPKNYSGYAYAPYTYVGPDVTGSNAAAIQPAGAGLQSLFAQTVGTRWIGPSVVFDMTTDWLKSLTGGA
jgi:hypothetical protein